MNKIKILYVCGGSFDSGGISTFLINCFRRLDKSQFDIDFAVFDCRKGIYDDEITKAGSKIFYLPPKKKNYFKNLFLLKKIFKNKKYDIAHSHLDSGNYYSLRIAKKCGIKVRISHSHASSYNGNSFFVFRIINKFYIKNINKVATHLLACSNSAGNYLYGNLNYTVLRNGIEYNKFSFKEKFRNEIRKKYDIRPDEILIGQIGHYSKIKNQQFTISLMPELLKRNPKYKIMFIGDGDDKKTLVEFAKDNNFLDRIIFLDPCTAVYKFYNSFDLFVVPSLSEGLPYVAIEAQANGLKCYISTGVPNEAVVLKSTKRLELNKQIWIEHISKEMPLRVNSRDTFMESDFNLNNEIKILKKYYKDSLKDIKY